MNTQELLDVLDILKNEDLYNERLSELHKVEKTLSDSRFIAATVAQANSYREEAKEELARTKKDAERQKQEAKESIKQEYEKLSSSQSRFKAEKVQVELQASNTREKLSTIRSLEEAMRLQDKNNRDWSDKLNSREKELSVREILLKNRLQQMQQIMKDSNA